MIQILAVVLTSALQIQGLNAKEILPPKQGAAASIKANLAPRNSTPKLPNFVFTTGFGGLISTTVPITSMDLRMTVVPGPRNGYMSNIGFPIFSITKPVDKNSDLPYEALAEWFGFCQAKLNTATCTVDFPGGVSVREIKYTLAPDGTPMETIEMSADGGFRITWK